MIFLSPKNSKSQCLKCSKRSGGYENSTQKFVNNNNKLIMPYVHWWIQSPRVIWSRGVLSITPSILKTAKSIFNSSLSFAESCVPCLMRMPICKILRRWNNNIIMQSIQVRYAVNKWLLTGEIYSQYTITGEICSQYRWDSRIGGGCEGNMCTEKSMGAVPKLHDEWYSV